MKKLTNILLPGSFIVICLLLSQGMNADDKTKATLTKTGVAQGLFAPPEGKVLVFVGQDNKSVGGTKDYQNGYVDHVGVPAGITHYVYFAEGKDNSFGFTFDHGSVDGLNKQTTWGAGPMCMVCYLESGTFANTLVHLSISMEFDSEQEIAEGKHEHLIDELAVFLKRYAHVPFLLRIGYEFDGSWNHYEPDAFKLAWRRIVDGLRGAGADNFATVLASSRHHIKREVWDAYWPGDDYVDWIGYSFWSNEARHPVALELAREKGLPVFIAEITPRGFWLAQTNGGMIWQDWFAVLFDHIEQNKDVIRAISYINTHWDADPMWKGKGWGDSRIETNLELKKRWSEKMAESMYLHSPVGVYDLIGFKPETRNRVQGHRGATGNAFR